MNLAKELKKKRDAEARLDKNSPTKIFTEVVAGEPAYNDLSQFLKNAVKKLNGLDGNVTLSEGDNITLTVEGNEIIISSTGGGIGEIPQATETKLGGIKAKAKTTESIEVAIDTSTGRLYIPSSGGGGGTDAESILTKPINIPSFSGKDGYILAYNEATGEFYLKQDEGGGGGGFNLFGAKSLDVIIATNIVI